MSDPTVRRGPRCPGCRHPSTSLKPLESGTEQGTDPQWVVVGISWDGNAAKDKGSREEAVCAAAGLGSWAWGRRAGTQPDESLP